MTRNVVVRAKHYAKRKHRSVSRIIEDYLRVISMDEPVGRDDTDLLLEALEETNR